MRSHQVASTKLAEAGAALVTVTVAGIVDEAERTKNVHKKCLMQVSREESIYQGMQQWFLIELEIQPITWTFKKMIIGLISFLKVEVQLT